MKKNSISLKTLFTVLSVMTILSSAMGGYFYYSTLLKNSKANANKAATDYLYNLGNHIDSSLTWSFLYARSLAGLKEMKQSLLNGDDKILSDTNETLKNFQENIKASVCYLMDHSGNTVASSNYKASNSFVGKNYGFRPYFKEAIQGTPAVYMALGVTSKKRGIYYSYPVFKKGEEKPLGVAVIKLSTKRIEKSFKKPPGGVVLLTDPQDVVFISSQTDWLYHVLWKKSPEEISDIIKTKQFGSGPINWTGMKRIDGNRAVDNLGSHYHVYRHAIANYPGWTLVYLNSYNEIRQQIIHPLEKSIGIGVLTVCLFIGLIVFLLFIKANENIIKREKAEVALRKEIHERKLAEKKTMTSLSILESTTDGILVEDEKGKMVRYNNKCAQMWKLPLEIVTAGDANAALNFALDQLEKPDLFVKKRKELYRFPEKSTFDVLVFKDGRIFERYSQPQKLDDKIIGRVWSFRDITEQKRLQNELLRSHNLESLGELAGGIAHDFNNLLFLILGNLSLAMNNLSSDKSILTELEKAEKACILAKELTAKLITFSKGGEPFKRLISIKELIKDIVVQALHGTTIELDLSIDDNAGQVNIDEKQIRQAVQNIINNAKEAMDEKGKLKVTSENVNISEKNSLQLNQGHYIKIAFKDHGRGIPKKNLKKIFDPYFSTKERGNIKGQGLGLTATYSIIKKHKGLITAESDLKKGSIFTLYLPAVNSSKKASENISKSKEKP